MLLSLKKNITIFENVKYPTNYTSSNFKNPEVWKKVEQEFNASSNIFREENMRILNKSPVNIYTKTIINEIKILASTYRRLKFKYNPI